MPAVVVFASMLKQVYRADLKSAGKNFPCGFKSHWRHLASKTFNMNSKEPNELLMLIGNLLLYVGKGEMNRGHAACLLRDYMFNHNYPNEVMIDIIKRVTSLIFLETTENNS